MAATIKGFDNYELDTERFELRCDGEPAAMEPAEEARERAAARGDVLGEAYALLLGAVARDRIAVLRWDAGTGRSGTYGPASSEDEATLLTAQSALDRAAGLLSVREERGLRSSILYDTSRHGTQKRLAMRHDPPS